MQTRRIGVLLLAMAAVLLVALGPAGTASAHAELLEISPADGAVLPEAPAEAVLQFSEHVSLTGGSAAVLDDTGAPVSAAASVVDVNVVIPLDGGLGDGTYTISWSVISTDSHRISGASVFHVGAPSAGGPVDVASSGGAGWGVRLAASLLTAIGYAGALVGVGGWWFTMLVIRRAPDPRWAMVIDRAAILAVSALIAAIPMRIARLGGGMSALADGDLLSESLRGPIGVSTAVTVSALLAMTAFIGLAERRWSLAWGGAVAGAMRTGRVRHRGAHAIAGSARRDGRPRRRPLGGRGAVARRHRRARGLVPGKHRSR